MPNLKIAAPLFMVTAMSKSLDFYVRGLGFEVKHDRKPVGKTEWCWLERDGVALMLQEYQPGVVPKDKVGIGVAMYVVCEDAIALYKEFRAKEMVVDKPFVGNNMWVVGLKDPDGYVLNFESATDLPEGSRYSD